MEEHDGVRLPIPMAADCSVCKTVVGTVVYRNEYVGGLSETVCHQYLLKLPR